MLASARHGLVRDAGARGRLQRRRRRSHRCGPRPGDAGRDGARREPEHPPRRGLPRRQRQVRPAGPGRVLRRAARRRRAPTWSASRRATSASSTSSGPRRRHLRRRLRGRVGRRRRDRPGDRPHAPTRCSRQQRFRLAGPLRTALWVRVATDAGAVDFWTTHLASGSDNRPCDDGDLPAAVPGRRRPQHLPGPPGRGASPASTGRPDSTLFVGGDLNAEPGSPTISAMLATGLTDTHLAAGNAECDRGHGRRPAPAAGTTRASRASPTPRPQQSERIDYLLFDAGGTRCEVVDPTGLFEADGRDRPATTASPTRRTTPASRRRSAADDRRAARGGREGDHLVDHHHDPSRGRRSTPPPRKRSPARSRRSSAGPRTSRPGSPPIEDGEALREVVEAGFAANQDIASRITVTVPT